MSPYRGMKSKMKYLLLLLLASSAFASDLSDIQSALAVKLIGSDATGVETAPVDVDFGVSTAAVRSACQLGNATGAVNFNFGAVGAQTVRTASQMGNATGAADFNFGAVGVQTLRAASEIGNATGAANFDYGTVGAQTVRTAAQLGNATGAALFGAGATTAQVLRAVLPTDQTGINTFQDKSGSGTITALNGAVTATTNGAETVTFDITGTFTATLLVQGTSNGGTTWTGMLAQVPLGGLTAAANNTGALIVPCGGYSQVRLFASAYTSGTASVTWNSGAGGNVNQVVQFTAANLQSTARLNDGAGTSIGSNYGAASGALRVASQMGDASGNVTPAGDVNARGIHVVLGGGPTLSANAPTAATVGTGSAQALASNASRTGLILTNTSNRTISCAFGATAVLNSGVTLYPGGVFTMDSMTFATGAVNCIAGGASSNLAIQEYQ